MRTVGYEEALALLTKVVNEAGADYVYPNRDGDVACLYAYEGKPDCGVGHVLYKLGVSIEDMTYNSLDPEASGPYSTESFSAVALNLRDGADLDFTTSARLLLSHFQSEQDAGVPWGKARDVAMKATAKRDES